jgi:hypothetical protein
MPKQMTKCTAKEKDDGGSSKTTDELAAKEREHSEKEAVAAAGSSDHSLAAFHAPARSFATSNCSPWRHRATTPTGLSLCEFPAHCSSMSFKHLSNQNDIFRYYLPMNRPD